jgi:hypothetical protein
VRAVLQPPAMRGGTVPTYLVILWPCKGPHPDGHLVTCRARNVESSTCVPIAPSPPAIPVAPAAPARRLRFEGSLSSQAGDHLSSDAWNGRVCAGTTPTPRNQPAREPFAAIREIEASLPSWAHLPPLCPACARAASTTSMSCSVGLLAGQAGARPPTLRA